VPFFLVAALGLAVATLTVLTTRDPPRGRAEAALQAAFAEGFAYEERMTWAKLRRILAIPTNSLIIAQGFPGCLPWCGRVAREFGARWTALAVRSLALNLQTPTPDPQIVRGVVMAYMNDYLIQERGLTRAYATQTVLLFGAGSILGAAGGGALGQALYNRRKGFICLFTGARAAHVLC